jgi:hypothetical protein
MVFIWFISPPVFIISLIISLIGRLIGLVILLIIIHCLVMSLTVVFMRMFTLLIINHSLVMGLVMVFMRVVINLLVVLSLIMSLVVALMSMVIDHNSKWIHKVPLLSEVKENLSFIEVTHFEDLLRILIFPTDHTIVISQITLVVIVLNVTFFPVLIF